MRMKRFRGEGWALLGMIWALAWPTMLEQLMSTAVQYVDAAMVGRLGAQATAAVGATTTVSWLIGSLYIMPLLCTRRLSRQTARELPSRLTAAPGKPPICCFGKDCSAKK